MIAHPWHEIPAGSQTPDIVNGIIEIPRGSKAKYELDKTTGLLKLDRVLFSDLTYPCHYGLIPQTYCDDNDPLDILVLCSEPLIPLTLVEARVVGAMVMTDGGEGDDKIIAVAHHDRMLSHIQELSQIPSQQLKDIKNFFQDYKKLEQKDVKIERFLEREEAYTVVQNGMQLYKKTFGK